MKAFYAFFLLTAMVIGQSAIAAPNYVCNSSGNLVLKIVENHNSLLGDTYFKITGPDSETHLHGTKSDSNGMLYKIVTYDIYGTDDLVTLISSPASCGRGSCRFAGLDNLTVTVELEGKSYYFYCN